MANVKITDLTAYTDPLNTDVLPIVDVTNNVTKKVSIANLAKNVSLGTAALPGVAFDGDPNTGIYSPGADQLAISTSGTERFRIDSSGRLLVGTSSNDSNAIAVIQGIAGNAATSGVLALRYGSTRPSANTLIGAIRFESTSNTASSYHYAQISAISDGASSSDTDIPGRLVFSTTSGGAGSPTERMRISSNGSICLGQEAVIYASPAAGTHVIWGATQNAGDLVLSVASRFATPVLFFVADAAGQNAAACAFSLGKNAATSRSINAGGTINASGADYAEYMVKAGDFTLAKGDICGVTADGQLTTEFVNAVSFVVKSTNPSYVGSDTWGSEDAVGPKPEADDVDALAQWESDLEAARQLVDRIAFAGQVPVNVTGATPGQYIVPIATEDGGITGVAKNEADLTLAEYMRAVGKVIAIEDDERARIIVKVA